MFQASYDYMKLMVSELQRQLEEIDSRNKGHTTNNDAAPKAPPRRQNPFNKPSTSNNQSFNPTGTSKPLTRFVHILKRYSNPKGDVTISVVSQTEKYENDPSSGCI